MYPIADPFFSSGVSRKAWSKLPDDLKKIVLEEHDKLFQETWNQYTPESAYEEAYKFFKDNGGKILDMFSEQDRKNIQKTAFEVWQELAKKAGPAALENYETLKTALE
jgi:TRAP-type C4-dicarboxylate transport system substrate-binding protein